MGRLVVVLDPALKIRPVELASAWDGDGEARTAGTATVDTAEPGDFSGVLELVVVPLAVNLASGAITAMLRRLLHKLRQDPSDAPVLEITETMLASGDRIFVVGIRGARK